MRMPLLLVSSCADAAQLRVHSRPCYIMRRCAPLPACAHCTCIKIPLLMGASRQGFALRAAQPALCKMAAGASVHLVGAAFPTRRNLSVLHAARLRAVPGLLVGRILRVSTRASVRA